MPVPDILVGTECRTQMLHGFESMARVLAVTLGPLGGTVINQRVNSTEPELLADGATILRRITELPDRVETVGAMLMRHIVWHMRKEYGDGSATAAVLARSIGRDLHRLIVAGADPISLQRGVEKGVQAASSALTDLALPLEKADHISGLANAAVHEPEISKLLGEIYEVLGPYGNVILQPGYGVGHDTAFRTGSRFPGEYLSRHLLSDTLRHIAALSEPYVLVADIHFNTAEDVAPVLELVAQAEGKHLFIICKNMWRRPLIPWSSTIAGASSPRMPPPSSPLKTCAAT
ncbi:hypothetical protein KFU94_43685 [Chloroflexi bacterium TSY]|nr:hypothetical protein [Chloroflexi bacterium TSY]